MLWIYARICIKCAWQGKINFESQICTNKYGAVTEVLGTKN